MIIAVDGHSSCGKSTLAKALADVLSYTYIDSGAMYRAVTLHVLQQEIPTTDHEAVAKELPHLHIDFIRDAENRYCTRLNGQVVEQEIRSLRISQAVSPVATIPEVRRHLVQQQRALAGQGQVTMDGRDIGTVVFPHAAVKIFLTAEMEVRVERRFRELYLRGLDVSRVQVRRNLYQRDYIDSTRSHSPLVKAPDAVLLDNSKLSHEEQLAICLTLIAVRQRKSGNV